MAKGDYSNVKDDVVKRMLENYDLSKEAESDNRKKGLEAIQFYRGGQAQWDKKLYNFRVGDNRPSESYNQIPKFIRQITNDIRQNKAQIKFLANTDGSKEVAELMEDLARAIQSTSEAEVAYDTAGFNAVVNGWGYFRFLTDYEDDEGFDQIIKIKWVPNSFKIYDDPYSTQQDFSDRRFLIEVEDIKLSEFNREYRKGKGVAKYDKLDLTSIGDASPDWASDDTIRIAEYWEVTDTTSQLWKNKKSGEITDEKPKDPNNYDVRDVTDSKVMWYKCNGMEVLEEQEWQGIYIPYVRISGETVYENGKVFYNGAVEAMMPPQKLYNYAANSIIERVSSQPLAPYLAAVGQIDGELQKYWDNANTKNYAWLPYNPIATETGQPIGPPQRQQQSADIGSLVEVLQMAQQGFNEASGQFQASIGAPSNEKSGKAIIARQREGDVSTFHFPDNLARGQRFGGRILADLMPKIYDGARAVRLLKEDKSDYIQKINQPLADELDEQGKPKEFDFTVGTYDVMVDTGPSYTTKRQEAAESQVQLAQAYPPLLQAAGDIIVRNMDWPGADKIADRLMKLLPPNLQDQPEMKDIPPEIQAQMQQMQQMLEQLQQLVQKQAEELQSKQADIQLKEADIAAKTQDMQSKGQSDQLKAEIDFKKLELEAAKLEFEKMKLASEQQLGTAKLQLDATKMRLDAKAGVANTDSVMADPDYHEGELPMATMLNSITEILSQGLNQVAQITAQSSQAIVESNALVAQSNSQVAAAIATPKHVVRDPATGMISGVTVQ